jgi:hypothetical protein
MSDISIGESGDICIGDLQRCFLISAGYGTSKKEAPRRALGDEQVAGPVRAEIGRQKINA